MADGHDKGMPMRALAALCAIVALAGCALPSRDGDASSRSRNRAAIERAEPPPETPASLRSRVQYELDRIEEELRVDASQQKAWDAYAARVVRFADDVARDRFGTRETASSIAMPQQFDRIDETARTRAASVADIARLARSLYATLKPEQARVADRRLAPIVSSLANGAPMPPSARREGSPPRPPP